MSGFVKLIFLNIFTILVTAEAPDCGVRNQFRGYCFSFDYCDSFACGSEKCGYFRKGSVLLKIKQTEIIPRCAITNSKSLKTVSGINSNIHVLASGSFADLPNLESILLPYNLIRELHHGIFYNVNVESIDLSWNKIIYISEGAFNGITGLKYLNLSRNELSTLPVRYFPNSLVDINLSHNFLSEIALNGAKQPDLASVDISYNNLEHVALSFDNALKKLDLSDNHLNDIDFYDINDCEDLKIPSNMFTKIPSFLIYSRIRRVALHPNPWMCDQLTRLWQHLQDNNIEEEKPNNTESQPLCAINTSQASSRIMNRASTRCEDDTDCPDNMLCRAHKCSDPCDNVCDSTNICQVSNHEIQCMCPGTGKKNPQELFSKCYDVECFSHSDCSSDQLCSYNQTCQTISFSYAPQTPSGYNGFKSGQTPSSAGSSSYFGQGYAAPGAYFPPRYPEYNSQQAPASGYGFQSGQVSYLGGDNIQRPGQGQSAIGYPIDRYPYSNSGADLGPQSFNDSTSISAYAYGGNSEDNPPPNLRAPDTTPWWFNDIPKLSPTNTIPTA